MKIIIAVALALMPGAALAQAATGKDFVTKAGASDLYERESSRLVAGTTANAKLKTFAQEMVKDHTTSTAEVKAAATKAGMKIAAPKLDATGTRNMAALRKAKGSARDSLYVEQQKAAHQQALELHQGYAANGTVAPLKAVAGKIAPVVQHHIDMLAGV